MFLRFFTVLLSLLALSACVLQSEKPLFPEADGVAALQPLGTTFVPFNLVDGQWQAEKDRASFASVGKHYEVKGDDGKTTSVLFVPLGQNSWLMQASEDGKNAAYLIARRDGKALLLQALFCEDLKKDAASTKRLRFDRDDCFVPADFKLAEFKALASNAPPAKMKLEAAE